MVPAQLTQGSDSEIPRARVNGRTHLHHGVAPGVIVVMSRAFAGEIAQLAASTAPQAEIISYADLLGRARASHAA